MDKIDSFTVNHLDLLCGLYVSRRDYVENQTLTTFDIRITRPNLEPVMDTAAVHTIEHLAATFLRNNPKISDKTIYFGPMGCRTGFYLILKGNLTPTDIKQDMDDLFKFMIDFAGEIPGAAARDCGNYLDMNLPMAKYYANKYKTQVLDVFSSACTNYPK